MTRDKFNKGIIYCFIILLGLLFLAGCGGGGSDSGSAASVISGTVLNASSQPVAGATISVGTASAVTGANGKYTLNVSSGTNLVVKASNIGFVDVIDVATVSVGQTTMIDFCLVAVGNSNALTAMSTTQTTATDSRGAKVTLPAGSVVNAAGVAVNTATVDVTTGMPSDANFTDNFPGLFIGTQGGADKAIESFGFVTIGITSGGQKCNLGAGKTAVIDIPVAVGADPGTAQIELWSLNEVTGKWSYEGMADRVASGGAFVYRATVSHFSTYNLDRPIANEMPLTVTVVAQGASATTVVAGASIVVTSTTTAGAKWEGRGFSGADGKCFFAKIPQGSITVKVTSGDKSGTGYGYQVINNEMTMTVTLMEMISKTITIVRMDGTNKVTVPGAFVNFFSEGGPGGGQGSTNATSDSNGNVTFLIPSNLSFGNLSASKTINSVSWSTFKNLTSINDIPAELELKAP